MKQLALVAVAMVGHILYGLYDGLAGIRLDGDISNDSCSSDLVMAEHWRERLLDMELVPDLLL